MAQASPPIGTALAFSALRHRDYRKYLHTTVISMMGDNIEHVISYWMIFQQFHSPALAGFAVISHWLPFLLFSFYAGSLADRHDCRRLIQIAQGLYMLTSLAWGLLFLTGTLQVWHAVVLLCIHGMAGVIFVPADQLILYDIVGPQHLQSAVRLSATGRQLSILFGPAWGLLANVLIYLPVTGLMVGPELRGRVIGLYMASFGLRVGSGMGGVPPYHPARRRGLTPCELSPMMPTPAYSTRMRM